MIKPLFNNVLVKPAEKEKVTAGGIYIPENATEKPQIGEVIAVGPEVKVVTVGKKVLYTKWGGNEIEHEGIDYLLIKDIDLLGIASV